MAQADLNREWPLRRGDAVPKLVVRGRRSMTSDGSHAFAMSGAIGAGYASTCTVKVEADIATGAALLGRP